MARVFRVFLIAISVVAIATLVIVQGAIGVEKAPVQLIAPGWGELKFPSPEAGSYQLPPLGKAADGHIVLSDNHKTSLREVFAEDKLTVLSFIYTSCDDINGCSLSTFVMQAVKQRLYKNPNTATKVKLLSVSFDPENDTPDVMQTYGQDFQSDTLEWLFATFDISHSRAAMQKTLRSYGQSVLREFENSEEGLKNSVSAHILKVFLIDRDQKIRNIYGVDFLHPDILVADIQTLLMEEL